MSRVTNITYREGSASDAEIARLRADRPVKVDPHRAFVFPNRVRDERRRHGYAKLLALSDALPDIPYIRLSKIERGEVFARADELVRISRVLGIAPRSLLIDVDGGFDMAEWAIPFLDRAVFDEAAEQLAVLLAAAFRERRHRDRALTLVTLETQFGLPPVIVSRIENAQKAISRWNAATLAGLCRIFDVADPRELSEHLVQQHAAGTFDTYLPAIGNPEVRLARTRERVAALAQNLDTLARAGETTQAVPIARSVEPQASVSATRHLPVFGAPLPGGLIAKVPAAGQVEAPAGAGPRAFGLRVCRPTLGGGLPGNATVIVDPDRYPAAEGIALVREGENYRLLATTIDRTSALIGYSLSPAHEIALDGLAAADVAAVIGAVFA